MGLFAKGIGVVGSTTIDQVVDQHRSVAKVGGVTTYAAITYSRSGLNTFVVTNIANTDRTIIDKLEQENLTVFNGETSRTTQFINNIQSDFRRQKALRRARPIQLQQLSNIVGRIGGLHLGPLHPDDIEPEILTALQDTRFKIFLDVQGYTRKIVNTNVSPAVSRHLPAALSAAHIIKANGTELKLILEHFHKGLAELMRSFDIEESVITLGPEGGWVETLGGEKFNYSAGRIGAETDPTGAGDVFFAAYLIGRLADHQDIPDACRRAARTAASQVAGKHISIDRLLLTER